MTRDPQSLDHLFERTPEQKRRILRERAEVLAQRIAPSQPRDHNLDIVEFLLARERYAVESPHVREVLPLQAATPIPCTPPFVHGIVNVRGKILSVIDLRVFFELPRTGTPPKSKVVILASKTMEIGILAEEVVGAYAIDRSTVLPPPPTLNGIRGAFLHGLVGADLILLDSVKLLNDPALVINEEP